MKDLLDKIAKNDQKVAQLHQENKQVRALKNKQMEMLNDCMRHLEDKIHSNMGLRLTQIEEKLPTYYEALNSRVIELLARFEEMKGPVFD